MQRKITKGDKIGFVAISFLAGLAVFDFVRDPGAVAAFWMGLGLVAWFICAVAVFAGPPEA